LKKWTVQEIDEKLQGIKDSKDPFIKKISKDERKGVQVALNKWFKQFEQQKQTEYLFYEMTQYERNVRGMGYKYISGIDEVGRGPLAGPVVAAAVILPESFTLLGINDSKKLSEQKREEYFEQIQEQAIAIGIGMIDAKEIDEINIYEATKKAMLAAVTNLTTPPDYLLIDAMKLITPYPQESIIKGDGKSITIAAASIIAKVTRDRLMKKIGEEYPQYGFSQNMGYGTKEHLLALEQYGVTPYHRRSFAPIKNINQMELELI